jgi:hypothetical protein
VHLAERFAVSPACVEANVVGEHGTSTLTRMMYWLNENRSCPSSETN